MAELSGPISGRGAGAPVRGLWPGSGAGGVGRARAIDGGAKNTDAASGRPLRASTALSFFSRLPRAALPPQPSTTAASRRAAATRASARAGAPASEPPSLEKRGLSNVHFFAVKKAAVKTTIGRERLMHFKLHLAYGRCSRVLYLIHTGGGSPIANPIKHGTKLRCRGSPELHTLFPPCIAGYGPTLCVPVRAVVSESNRDLNLKKWEPPQP